MVVLLWKNPLSSCIILVNGGWLTQHVCVKAVRSPCRVIAREEQRAAKQPSHGLKPGNKWTTADLLRHTSLEERNGVAGADYVDTDEDLASLSCLSVAVADPDRDNTDRKSTRAAATPPSELGFSSRWEVSVCRLRIAAQTASRHAVRTFL
ncbi:hypothetical protein NQZ68_021178 [Dissostichus eleginoides]|nr:hypothetical protein NQZ68_021178 [Dissostichus eleginoides]